MKTKLRLVTDSNYEEFIANQKAALLLTLSSCPHCQTIKPFIENLSKHNSTIQFGEAILNHGHLIKLKKLPLPYYMPSIMFFKEGKHVHTLESTPGFGLRQEQIMQCIFNILGLK